MDHGKMKSSARARGRAGKTVVYLLLSVWAVMVLFP